MPIIYNTYINDLQECNLRIGSHNVLPNLIKAGSSGIKGLSLGGGEILHPEAVYWAKRVYNNSGGINTSTLAQVSRFCYAIDAAGLRDRFSRLNLFIGNNFYDMTSNSQRYALNAALVPLYVGFYYDPGHHGDIGYNYLNLDVNYNFIENDYSDSTGLTSDGGKFLSVGLTTYDSTGGSDPANDSHMSVYTISSTSTNSYNMIGNVYGTGNYYDGYLIGLDWYNSSGNISPGAVFGYAEIDQSAYTTRYAANSGSSSSAQGLFLGTKSSINSGYIYRNDTNITTHTGGYGYATTDASDIGVFNTYSQYFDYDPFEGGYGYGGSIGSYSLGKYMTPSQVSDYYSILQAFHTYMGRNV
jgi:hypothetical protein